MNTPNGIQLEMIRNKVGELISIAIMKEMTNMGQQQSAYDTVRLTDLAELINSYTNLIDMERG